jgi:hypothetical protein
VTTKEITHMEVVERVEPPASALALQSQSTALTSAAVGQLVSVAAERGANSEELGRLILLHERLEANEARRQFNVDFAAFKAEAIEIVKSKLITDGPLKGKKHAELAAICAAITPALSRHGLSASWKLTKDERDWMEVTCTLAHVGGHAESVSMGGAPDTGPGRNAMQARGSAKTYLERYTLTAITGIAAKEQDDDGAGGPKQTTDITALLVGLGSMTTDATALAYWNTNKAQLAGDKAAADAFKKAVVEHRQNLKRGAA